MRAPPRLRCLRVVGRSSHTARQGRGRAPRRLCPFGPQRTSPRELGCACQQAHASPRFGGAARGARAAATAAFTLTVSQGARPRAPGFRRPPPPHPPQERRQDGGRGKTRALGARCGEKRPLRVFGVPMRAHVGPPSPPFAAPAAPRTRPRTWASREPGADVWWRGAGRRGGRICRRESVAEKRSCRAHPVEKRSFLTRARAPKKPSGDVDRVRKAAVDASGRPSVSSAHAARAAVDPSGVAGSAAASQGRPPVSSGCVVTPPLRP